MTVAATNSPAQRGAIRPAAMKRSIQPLRHANRRAQAAAVVRDFTSAPIKRSPQFDFLGDAADAVADGLGDAAKAVADGTGKAVDAAGNLFKQAGDEVGQIVDEASGEVLDVVKAVCIHRLSLLIETDDVL
jgi:hypothetical protein